MRISLAIISCILAMSRLHFTNAFYNAKAILESADDIQIVKKASLPKLLDLFRKAAESRFGGTDAEAGNLFTDQPTSQQIVVVDDSEYVDDIETVGINNGIIQEVNLQGSRFQEPVELDRPDGHRRHHHHRRHRHHRRRYYD